MQILKKQKETMQNFIVKKRKIGNNHPPLVIAELGINHGGSLDLAIHLCDKAANLA